MTSNLIGNFESDPRKMKAVITAAGLGTRSGLNGVLRKELLPLYDVRDGKMALRPILDILAFRLRDMGIRDVAIVLDPEDLVTESYVRKALPWCTILYQKEKAGFGDACLQAGDFIGNEGFILAAGDATVWDFSKIQDLLCSSLGSERWTLLVMKVEDARRYGVALIDDSSEPPKVKGVLEKPSNPPSNYAMCAFYYLPPSIFEFIERTGGKEITDAIDLAIKEGIEFRALEISRKNWISVGVAEEYLNALRSSYDSVKRKIKN
ncbi:MAG: sugar phosphate nucleotidyltransferase [Thermoplasmatales archaeon]